MSRVDRRWPGLIAAATLPVLLVVVGCTSDDDEPSGVGSGVLDVSDLPGDGWTAIPESERGTLCGSVSSAVGSMSGVAEESSAVTLERDGVSVISHAWIEVRDSATRPRDLDRIRAHTEALDCLPVDEPGDQGLTAYEVVASDDDRLVVHEEHIVAREERSSDQLYFQEGPVVGRVVVVYEGDTPPVSVTELEDAARSRAAELAGTDA